jgi:hypothetical protein
MNTIFALFEIFLTNVGPPPWLNLPLLVLILGGYLGVAYITHASQGFYGIPYKLVSYHPSHVFFSILVPRSC